ncbi:EAL domain-containing protein [Siccirubricoccus sp. KC 17139]|uniref:EAL domain-containing protein n=1 Tax=Siccirubricoccus soli TaxID=2899147 RepID=A0ABT1D3I3_9PROT|nr:EAL domain-containing protein [Siccirubricoccus soli]MCO6415769.1 EAL domain-containing protein [Siccirubricoccus soli]MCP2681901.1 EAL domain-containing protein [Siccirubricoccus soli]
MEFAAHPLRGRPLGLRARLILAFLAMALLVLLTGGAASIYVQRGQDRLGLLAEIATPLRSESAELRLTAQRMQATLMAALAASDTTDEELDAQLAAFEALRRSSEAGLGRIGILAARAGVVLPLDHAAAATAEVIRLMTEMVAAHRQRLAATQKRLERQREYRARLGELRSAVQPYVGDTALAMATLLGRMRAAAEAGTFSPAEELALAGAMSRAIHPVLPAIGAMMEARLAINAQTDMLLGLADPVAMAAETRQLLALRARAAAAVEILLARLGAAEAYMPRDPAREALLLEVLDGMDRALYGADGVLAYHRVALEAAAAVARGERALRQADDRLADALASTATLAEELEDRAREAAEGTARQARFALAASGLGGALLAVLLGVLFTRRLLGPLTRLEEAVRNLSEGRLGARLEGAARRDEAEAVAASVLDRVAHLATHDALTGLPNRALFRDRLDQALAQARRQGTTLVVHCIDRDRFKEVNVTLGHAAGDLLLTQVATRLQACIRETDTLARLGGDEFAVVQCGAIPPAEVEALARRMVEALAEPFDLNGHQAIIGTSIGIALRQGGEALVDPALLLQEADVALYQAKDAGRGTWCFFETEMNARLQARKALEADLRLALAEGRFSLHYQPQFDLAHRRLVGAEALLRWDHPARGPLLPEQFMPLAEETGLIGPIGAWVLGEACRRAAAWPALPRIAVNVSPGQFRRAGFIAMVERSLRESGLAPERLELEVPEALLMSDAEATLAALTRLRALGVTVALDDFGTGNSSLGTLRRFAFDRIKIDRSFIRGLGTDRDATAIIRAVLGMSRALGIRTQAGGVEDERQAAMLAGEGCEEVQGYLYGRPASAEEFAALLPRLAPVAG